MIIDSIQSPEIPRQVGNVDPIALDRVSTLDFAVSLACQAAVIAGFDQPQVAMPQMPVQMPAEPQYAQQEQYGLAG